MTRLEYFCQNLIDQNCELSELINIVETIDNTSEMMTYIFIASIMLDESSCEAFVSSVRQIETHKEIEDAIVSLDCCYDADDILDTDTDCFKGMYTGVLESLSNDKQLSLSNILKLDNISLLYDKLDELENNVSTFPDEVELVSNFFQREYVEELIYDEDYEELAEYIEDSYKVAS